MDFRTQTNRLGHAAILSPDEGRLRLSETGLSAIVTCAYRNPAQVRRGTDGRPQNRIS